MEVVIPIANWAVVLCPDLVQLLEQDVAIVFTAKLEGLKVDKLRVLWVLDFMNLVLQSNDFGDVFDHSQLLLGQFFSFIFFLDRDQIRDWPNKVDLLNWEERIVSGLLGTDVKYLGSHGDSESEC